MLMKRRYCFLIRRVRVKQDKHIAVIYHFIYEMSTVMVPDSNQSTDSAGSNGLTVHHGLHLDKDPSITEVINASIFKQRQLH